MTTPTNKIFEDFFTGTDGDDLTAHTPDTGTGWTAQYEPNASNIAEINASNQCKTVGGSGFFKVYTISDSLNNDQKAEANWYRSSDSEGLIIRHSNQVPASDNFDGYLVTMRFGATQRMRIVRVDAGALTVLENIVTTPSSGDKIAIQQVGTRLNAYRNGALVSANTTDDSTYTSGAAGFQALGAIDPLMDNFAAYDDSGGAPSSQNKGAIGGMFGL